MSLDPLSLASEATVNENCNASICSAPKIELDEHSSAMCVSDSRLFHAGRRAFSRRLLDALCNRQGVKKAWIDLETSTCRIDFEHEHHSPSFMAQAFVQAIQAASTNPKKRSLWSGAGRWSSLIAYRTEIGVSVWQTHNGRENLELQRRLTPRSRKEALDLKEQLEDVNGVKKCTLSAWSPQITIVCRDGGGKTAETVDRVEAILESKPLANPIEKTGTKSESPTAPQLARGWKRLRYCALAGGSFVMAVIGLIVPGIPTVPFLLATSYYLARSSPKLDKRLRGAVFFGPILTEWETRGAVSRRSKVKLVGLTVVIVLITIVFASASPIAVVFILLVAAISVLGVVRMPEFEEVGHGETNAIGERPAIAAS